MSTRANDGDCPVFGKDSLVSSFGHKYTWAWATICCLNILEARFMDEEPQQHMIKYLTG